MKIINKHNQNKVVVVIVIVIVVIVVVIVVMVAKVVASKVAYIVDEFYESSNKPLDFKANLQS